MLKLIILLFKFLQNYLFISYLNIDFFQGLRKNTGHFFIKLINLIRLFDLFQCFSRKSFFNILFQFFILFLAHIDELK
jgi:hypothetical protein